MVFLFSITLPMCGFTINSLQTDSTSKYEMHKTKYYALLVPLVSCQILPTVKYCFCCIVKLPMMITCIDATMCTGSDTYHWMSIATTPWSSEEWQSIYNNLTTQPSTVIQEVFHKGEFRWCRARALCSLTSLYHSWPYHTFNSIVMVSMYHGGGSWHACHRP